MTDRVRSHAFILILGAMALMCPGIVAGQSAESANTFYQTSLTNAINTLSADQRGLYNGTEYVRSTLVTGGHQFFLSDGFLSGTIVYNGSLYQGVNLIYDISTDDVVVENGNGSLLKLVKENVDEFVVENHVFRHLRKPGSLPSGFYDILFDNNQLVLCARRSKKLKLSNWRQTVVYYLINKNQYSVVTKKNIATLLPDKGKEVRSFIEKNKLTFRKNKENSLIKIMQYYNTL